MRIPSLDYKQGVHEILQVLVLDKTTTIRNKITSIVLFYTVYSSLHKPKQYKHKNCIF